MNIGVLIECECWRNINVQEITEEAVQNTFLVMNIKSDNIEVCFLFTNDDEVRNLNKSYRGIDKTTNVLSFSALSSDNNLNDNYDDEENDECVLGSVAIAFETIENEANEQEKTMENHLKHIIIHSLLHLLGYDHIDSKECIKMEEIEIKILEKMNINNPYI